MRPHEVGAEGNTDSTLPSKTQTKQKHSYERWQEK